MSHENENPLIIDVVGEVEPPESPEWHASKKAGRSAGKKGFFRKEKSASAAAATQEAASEAEVDAAKRAAVAAAVPPVQGSVSQPQPEVAQAVQETQPQVQQVAQAVQEAQPQPQQVSEPVQPVQEAQPQPQQAAQPVQAPVQQPVQPAQPVQPVQPVQPTAVPVPVAAPIPQGNMAAAAVEPQRSKAVYVFVILAVLVVAFALAALSYFMFFQGNDQEALAPVVQADFESGEVRPIGSVSLDQASKVSIRATAEGWNEETSTPLIAYIKRVEDVSSADDEDASSTTSADDEQYFAFAPNKNASVSLAAGRYTFSFIPPMNSDGSIYSVPDMVSMVVGDGGMAVLPVDPTLIPKDEVTQEQITRILAQLKTASEKGGESFDHEPFRKSIDLALNTWFPQGDTTTEQPATDLTQEQQDTLNAQADSQTETQNGTSSSTSSTAHTHTWVAQYEQRWEPEIVPVIDMAAWESPVYARYRCQEGVLFETLDACLAHVRERGNESYTTSNEIIRIDYHPAVVHYEEQGRYVNVVTGYRCSACGATGTLS